MRTIEIDIDVFAAIWKLRLPNENNENQILRRILGVDAAANSTQELRRVNNVAPKRSSKEGKTSMLDSCENGVFAAGKIRWVDDVYQALKELGGSATLYEIYKAVERRRRGSGRSVPKTLEATIRRTLEDHSSDSANFRGVDLFKKIGRGEWAIR